MNRTEFIKAAGRWTVMALIAGLAALIIGKRQLTTGASCAGGEFCRNCGKFNSCGLPQAREQR